MMKQFQIIVFLVLQAFFTQAACSSSNDTFDYSDLWMSKTSGTWESGKDYGYYRVLVMRKIGAENSQDNVFIQIVKREKNTNTVIHTIKLDSPGYVGYVKDITLVNIAELNKMALHMDIEMKAMDGITMREIYLISPNGKVKSLIQAKYIDIYDE